MSHTETSVARPLLPARGFTLRTVLASLAEGSSFDETLKDYPSLSEDQLRAAVGVKFAKFQESEAASV